MENSDQKEKIMVEEFWKSFFLEGPPIEKIRRQRFFRFLPGDSRCKFCFAPFDGFSGLISKSIFQTYPSRYNPHYCNVCDDFSTKYQGGAEIPIAMLFADIRGSSSLAEKIDPLEFSNLINRFFVTSTHVLAEAGAMIEKLVGDEVTAVFSQGISGENYFGKAVHAAKDLLRETGHGDGNKPWVELGIGIHSGKAFVGSVGKPNGIMEVAALGEVPNTAARLTSLAGPGEILISESTLNAAHINTDGLKKRKLALKGHKKDITAFVMSV